MELVLTEDGANINLTRPPYLTEGLSLAAIANKGGGKSWLLAVLAEESHRNRIPFIYYDVNGDAASLRQLGDDVVLIGRTHKDPLRNAHFSIDNAAQSPVQYINLALEDGFSVIFDLSGRPLQEKCEMFSYFVNAHFGLSEDLREPTMVLVDEAHQFAPQRKPQGNQRQSLQELVNIMSDGRKRGILLSIATQRAAYLNKDVLFGMNVRMFGKITWQPDFEAIKSYLPPGVRFEQMRHLTSGKFYLVSANGYGVIKVKQRRTKDLGATPVIRRQRKRPRPSVKQLSLFGNGNSATPTGADNTAHNVQGMDVWFRKFS